jgi:hypothetical protein
VTGAAADDPAGGTSARLDDPFDEPPPGEQPDDSSMPNMPIALPHTLTPTQPRTSKQAGLGTRNHLQFMSS